VICELANDDGTVMKGPQITAFAARHGLKQITVAELIAHRQSREKLVERVHSFPVRTAFGEMTGHVYVTPFEDTQHFAFVMGKIGDGEKVPARLHRADVVADVLSGAGTIQSALRRFQQEGRGVLVYLRDGSAGVPIKSTEEEDSGALRNRQWREVGLGAQILRDLGVASIVNLASSPRSYVGLSGFGIEIAETAPPE
jgi:3,4-dihydroxy 2-butanone 4-phosphate synthase/GTP cyclohydrolase II